MQKQLLIVKNSLIFSLFLFHLPVFASFDINDGYQQLQQIRRQAGMLLFKRNIEIEKATQGHANYLAQHHLNGHIQSSSLSGFTGERPVDRILTTQYPTNSISENVSTGQTSVKSSIDDLMSAIYHRFGFLDPSKDEVGIGIQLDNTSSRGSFVYNMGDSLLGDLCEKNSFTGTGSFFPDICKNGNKIGSNEYHNAADRMKARNPEVIVWPANGANDIPPAFFEESPDPLPDFSVSGYPISIEFNDFYVSEVQLKRFQLFDQDGIEITHTRLLSEENDPNQSFNANQFVLFPLERLNWDTRYRVEISYLSKGIEKTKQWQFQTRKPANANVFNIQGQNETIRIGSGSIFAVYISPTSPQDNSVGEVNASFSAGSQITLDFADSNTLLIRYQGQVGDTANITTSKGKQFSITINDNSPLTTQVRPVPEGSCYTEGVHALLVDNVIQMPHILVDGVGAFDVEMQIQDNTDPLIFDLIQVTPAKQIDISCRSGSYSFKKNELHLPDIEVPKIGFFNAELELINNQLRLKRVQMVN